MNTVDLDAVLTEDEKGVRKQWLMLFLAATVLGNILTLLQAFAGNEQERAIAAVVTYSTIPANLIFAGLLYWFCYRKHTTFLLTWVLVGFALTVASLAFLTGLGLFNGEWSFLKNMFAKYSSPAAFAVFVASWTVSAVYCFFTVKIRRINQVLRCYAKYPNECVEAAAFMEEGEYGEAIVKWPYLKPLLKRITNQ